MSAFPKSLISYDPEITICGFSDKRLLFINNKEKFVTSVANRTDNIGMCF